MASRKSRSADHQPRRPDEGLEGLSGRQQPLAAEGALLSEPREQLEQLGIRAPLHVYLSSGLGASEVRLLELAGAYRAMASGVSAEPHVIARVTGVSDAVVLYEAPRAASSLGSDGPRHGVGVGLWGDRGRGRRGRLDRLGVRGFRVSRVGGGVGCVGCVDGLG